MDTLVHWIRSHLATVGARLAIACFMLVAAAAPAHTILRIDLRPAADVSGTAVALADVATISGADPQAVSRLAAIDVGRVSADGQPTLVERDVLARWIQTRSGLMSQDIVWGGADRCRIRLAATASSDAQADVGVAPAGAPSPVAASPATRAGATRASAHPAVSRGTLATLRSLAGAIELESRVEVLEDGTVGQTVHVRLPGASEGVVARVTGAGQVEVAQ